jgi:hypothetical protein
LRRQLRQEERDAEGERTARTRQDRGDERAVDRDRRAEALAHGIPRRRPQELDAEGAEGGQAAEEQHDDDRAEQHQHAGGRSRARG